MRFAPFALVALLALPACAPYGYGYGGQPYGGPVYGAPGPAYGGPYYGGPAYAPPPREGVLLFDGDNGRRYDRPGDPYRPQGRQPDERQRAQQQQQQQQQGRPAPARAAPPPQQRPPAPAVQVRQGGGGHDPSYNPANPNAQGGGDR